MTTVATALSTASDAAKAGAELGSALREALGSQVAHAVLVFAAPDYDHATLLASLKQACNPEILLGCSSAGEFTSVTSSEHSACALAFSSDDMRFGLAVGKRVSASPASAAHEIVAAFQGLHLHEYRSHTAIVLADALAGSMDELIAHLTRESAGTYQFVGGGAGDNAQFHRTPVFCDTEVLDDAVVALEILSHKPIGLGVSHGWEPATAPMRVTGAQGLHLLSLNAVAAADVFSAFAAELGETFSSEAPLPFFLHHILGVREDDGWRLRVPLGVAANGSIACAAEIPEGSVVAIMRSTADATAAAAGTAAAAAVAQLEGETPGVVLFFDCVATRLRMGRAFDYELATLRDAVGQAEFIGCNTHGQIARAEGQFSGFHNCTAVACIFPN